MPKIRSTLRFSKPGLPGRRKRGGYTRRIVIALQHSQFRGIERLGPEANPVHPPTDEYPRLGQIKGVGIGLNGELPHAGKVEAGMQKIQRVVVKWLWREAWVCLRR